MRPPIVYVTLLCKPVAIKRKGISLGKHETTELDRARDELFSHIQRCGALDASEDDKDEWLEETIEYIAERYTNLTPLQLGHLEMMGKRYLRPAIPHGSRATAQNRTSWQAETVQEAEPATETEAEDPVTVVA